VDSRRENSRKGPYRQQKVWKTSEKATQGGRGTLINKHRGPWAKPPGALGGKKGRETEGGEHGVTLLGRIQVSARKRKLGFGQESPHRGSEALVQKVRGGAKDGRKKKNECYRLSS